MQCFKRKTDHYECTLSKQLKNKSVTKTHLQSKKCKTYRVAHRLTWDCREKCSKQIQGSEAT